VPTPFYHLSIGKTILYNSDLSDGARFLLQSQRCSFLFGQTAPDVQVISGQHRHETHFFYIPISSDQPLPWMSLFQQYPALAEPERLPADRAAFLAGYLCHLQADWLWILQIYGPRFSSEAGWDSQTKRAYIHNVMRTYLDVQALQSLPVGTGNCLDRVDPQGYLPFTASRHLFQWRDFISSQLKPGGIAQTVEVFSRRQGLDPQSFYDLLQSEERMENEVFSHISLEELERFRADLIEENICLVENYLAGQFASTHLSFDG
jgi:hypothetical protein